MLRTTYPRQVATALAILLVPGAFLTREAHAQDGGRMQILVVPALKNNTGTKNSFGEKVTDEVNKLLKEMATHRPVEMKELKDPLRKYGLKEDDLVDCIKARQLAGMQDVSIPLVLCGTYDEAASGASLKVQIISPANGETFDVAPFQAADPKQAAQQIVTQFQTYVQQLQFAFYCDEYLNSSNWPSALENCDKALAINPNSKAALYGRGQALWKMERREEALAAFQKILELEQGLDQNALLSAALVAAELGQNAESDKYFHEYLQLNPASKEVRLKVASDAAKAGNNEGALKIIEEGLVGELASDPVMREYAGHFAMNAANRKFANAGSNGNEAEGKALLTKALTYYEPIFVEKGNAIDQRILLNMLTAYRKLEQVDKAVEFGAKATSAQPNDAQILTGYADALNDANRKPEALAALDKVLTIDPSAAVNARRALWLVQSSDIAGARAALKLAIEKGEAPPDMQDQLSRQMAVQGYNDKSKVGQHQAAMPYYEAAKEFAQTPETKGMIAFFEGYAIYSLADASAKRDESLNNARATLPQFQKAAQLMEQAAAWGQQEANRRQILNAAQEWIAVQEAIIKRGR